MRSGVKSAAALPVCLADAEEVVATAVPAPALGAAPPLSLPLPLSLLPPPVDVADFEDAVIDAIAPLADVLMPLIDIIAEPGDAAATALAKETVRKAHAFMHMKNSTGTRHSSSGCTTSPGDVTRDSRTIILIALPVHLRQCQAGKNREDHSGEVHILNLVSGEVKRRR